MKTLLLILLPLILVSLVTGCATQTDAFGGTTDDFTVTPGKGYSTNQSGIMSE
jgi:hypothetical protein